MCLRLHNHYEDEKEKLDFDPKTKTRKCYKLFIKRPEDSYFLSPFTYKQAVLNEPYDSFRQNTELERFEMPGYFWADSPGELLNGIHLFLTAEDALKALKMSWCFLYKNEDWSNMVIVECECHKKDLVAVGENSCWGYSCKGAVFTWVLPRKVLQKENDT